MRQVMFGVVCACGFMLAINVDPRPLIMLALTVLLLAAGCSCLFRGKLPKDFWLTVLAVILGSCLVEAMVGWLVGQLAAIVLFKPMNLVLVALLLLLAMAISFLYVRAQIRRNWHKDDKRGQANERQPLFPVSNNPTEPRAINERD